MEFVCADTAKERVVTATAKESIACRVGGGVEVALGLDTARGVGVWGCLCTSKGPADAIDDLTAGVIEVHRCTPLPVLHVIAPDVLCQGRTSGACTVGVVKGELFVQGGDAEEV